MYFTESRLSTLAFVTHYFGTKAELDAKVQENGALYVITDLQEVWIDINDKRIKIASGIEEDIELDINEFLDALGVLSIEHGGTGAENVQDARNNLGINDVVQISDTQPTEANCMIWIKP